MRLGKSEFCIRPHWRFAATATANMILPDVQHKDYPSADCARNIEEKCEDERRFESELISIAKFALWERGASNACDRYWDLRKCFPGWEMFFQKPILRC